MDKLWIPYNGDKPKLSDQNLNLVAATNSAPFSLTGPSPFPSISKTVFVMDVEVQDLSGLYDPVTGIYTSNIW